MNCVEFKPSDTLDGQLVMTRTRWGGSLLEKTELDSPIKLVTLADHSIVPVESKTNSRVIQFEPTLNSSVTHSIVRDRVERIAGVTLATSPVVVSGGQRTGNQD